MYDSKIKKEDFLISEKPFFSIFLQSKAGYEEGIIKNLKNTLSEIKIKNIPLNLNFIKILKCFGHFDIAILFNLDSLEINVESFEKISQEISKIDYINDSNNIVGYSWDCSTDIKGLDFCWGICSIKLDLNIRNGTLNPIKIEKEVITNIIEISNKANIKIKVFGGLGWNELIVIVNSSSLKNISEFVYNIRVFDEILDISTIPAVEWGCWNSVKLETIPNCNILITHRSRKDYPIRELLILLAKKFNVIIDKTSQEDIGLIFGGFDIRLQIINSELNNIIKFVLGLRAIKTITKTNTIFSPMQIPPDNSLSQINLPDYLLDEALDNSISVKNIEIPISNKGSKLIDMLENEIRHLHYEYKELKSDDYTKSLYFDLNDFFKDLDLNINYAKKLELEVKKTKDLTQKRKLVILLEQLKKIIQSIEFSIYQRISGMQMSYLMEAKHTGFEKFGGIQRIILATEAIPMQIIKKTYLFRWEEIPGNDNERLIKFLMKNFSIEWVKEGKIKKNDDIKTISVTNEKNFLSLALNDEKTSVNLEIDDGRTDKFIVKTENGKLNIYQNWKGFCVFGSEPDFISQTVGEVISIPFEFKYQPEKWWGLGHEIGHLLMNRMKDQILIDFNEILRMNFENDFKDFLNDFEKINVCDKELLDEYRNREFEFIIETIVEICADYLNFKIVFFSDWNSFLNCTLTYLDGRGYDILSESRLIRVISISEHINNKGVEKDTIFLSVVKNIRNFARHDEFRLNDRINIVKSQTFLPYLKTVDKILNKIDTILSVNMNNELLNEIDIKLNRGEILESNSYINSDSLIIYILRSLINRDLNNDITFKHQIASILSLYNFRFSG